MQIELFDQAQPSPSTSTPRLYWAVMHYAWTGADGREKRAVCSGYGATPREALEACRGRANAKQRFGCNYPAPVADARWPVRFDVHAGAWDGPCNWTWRKELERRVGPVPEWLQGIVRAA